LLDLRGAKHRQQRATGRSDEMARTGVIGDCQRGIAHQRRVRPEVEPGQDRCAGKPREGLIFLARTRCDYHLTACRKQSWYQDIKSGPTLVDLLEGAPGERNDDQIASFDATRLAHCRSGCMGARGQAKRGCRRGRLFLSEQRRYQPPVRG